MCFFSLYLVHSGSKIILSELILTIAALTVRHELCLVVEEAGGLKFLLNAMVKQSAHVFQFY